MFARRLVVFAMLAGLAAGCELHQLRCPQLAGPAWREYDSQHFVVTTDLASPRARRLVGEFERTYRSFVDVTGWRFPGRGEPPGRMRVVVFSRRADYDAVGPDHSDGYYRPDSLAADSVVVIDNDGTHPPGEVFVHELTHRLLRYFVPDVPLGINEGLAEYFSTFTVRDGFALTGLPPPRLAVAFSRGGVQLPSLDVLFNTESLAGRTPAFVNSFYLGSWVLIHVMARFFPIALSDMLAQMANGQSLHDAFESGFGSSGWRDLDRIYGSFGWQIADGRVIIPSWRKPYTPPRDVGSVTDAQELTDGALHLLWADLQLGHHDIAPQVKLAQLHGGDSSQLAFMRALVALNRKDMEAAGRELSAAVDGNPGEERYHLTRARVLALKLTDPKQPPELLADDMKWLTDNGPSGNAHGLVALYDAIRGDMVAAREQALVALYRDPTNALAYLALAFVDAQSGDLEGAINAAERSLRLTSEGGGNEAAQRLLALLRYRRKLPQQSAGLEQPMRLQPPTLSTSSGRKPTAAPPAGPTPPSGR